ncbi:MAG: type II toxin-antitoxin system VapC family toxin [Dehalococcoidia bacterium]
MELPDVNVLMYALNEESRFHRQGRAWLEERVNGSERWAVSELTLSAVLRIATQPRLLAGRYSAAIVRSFVHAVRSAPSAVPLNPGPDHWGIFLGLCESLDLRGNAIPDAYLAALAIEHDCEFVTLDSGFGRFPGLRWRLLS